MPDRSVVVRLVANTAGFAGPLKSAAVQAKAFGVELDGASKKNSEGFKKLSEGATVAGGGIVAAFAGAVAITAQFDKQMSSVGAAASATSSQLGQLRDAAIAAGAATSFGATDAARAEEELAKAGVTVKDILGGGLTGALNLAAAGQLDLGKAAEISATAMTQFGLSGDQVPHIADLLSAAANKAQGSVEDVGMALKQGGLVAAQFGISIEQTTGTLAAFASAGLIGSDAGTSLKTMLLALANPSNKAASTMQELGLSAYDASGKFVGLQNFAGQLQDKLGGLSQETRNAALAQIFGSDAVRAANVLYKEGAQGIGDWTNKVNDTGNASRTAAAKLDNLSGDVEKLKGSLETALIQTGSQATGTLRVLAQAADGAVSSFTGLPGPAKEVVTVLGLAVGVALLAGGAYGALAPKIRVARDALTEMGPAGAKANTALGAVGKAAGVATLVFAGLQIASAAFAKDNDLAAVSADRLGTALTKFGETGKVTGEMTQVFSGGIKQLQQDLYSLDQSGVGGWTKKTEEWIQNSTGLWQDFDSSVQNSKARIDAADQSLAKLVESGHADEAAAAFERISKIAKDKDGINPKELAKGFDAYTLALKKSADAGNLAALAEDDAAQKTKVLGDGFRSAAEQADGLKTAWDTLNGALATTDSSLLKANQAVDAMKKSFQEYGKAIEGNSTAALSNRVAIEAVGKAGAEAAQAVLDGGGSVEQAQATWKRYHDQIVATLVQLGYTPAKAQAVADALDKMPKLVQTKVSVTGAEDAKAQVADVDRQIKGLKDKQVKIGSSGTDVANQQILSTQNRLDDLHDKKVLIQEEGAAVATGSVVGLNNSINVLKDKLVKVQESGAPGSAAEVKALKDQIAELQNKVVQVTAEVTYKSTNSIPGVVGGSKGLRWGGIVQHAANGLVRQATIAAGGSDVIHWAERGTGHEAYVPENGIKENSLGILKEAASWYGAQVVTSGMGSGSARPALVSPSRSTQAPSTVMSGPAIDYAKLGRAVAAAMGGVQVTLDGRKVGAIQGREADLYSRAG